eukprot:CAMPEP_0114244066 /NCGR_PEP_ID=MMETSP0058-20121206/11133_1 /TAXON_ID=36894 /ORGANISM="Pyramimonas parkeae, CCMP726" /LENGTH=417 /DNA_ID=CAMNT_0001356965 /DNA_START=353 /DNA_END=1606 /DNA_ORIENTATION=+
MKRSYVNRARVIAKASKITEKAIGAESWSEHSRARAFARSRGKNVETVADETRTATWDGVIDLLKKAATLGSLAVCIAMATLFANPGEAMAARSGGRMGGGMGGFSSRSSGMRSSTAGGSFLGSGGGAGGSGGFGTRAYSTSGNTVHHHHHHSGGGNLAGIGTGMVMGSMLSGGHYGHHSGYGHGGLSMAGVFRFASFCLMGVFMIGALKNLFGGGDDADQYGGGGYSYDDEGMTVCRLQVGLLGTARDLQSDLNRIADRADTGSEDGLHYILTETVLSLMRNPQYWVYGAVASASEDSPESAERRFSSLSMEERSKIKEETLVNVDERRRASDNVPVSGDRVTNEFILVTILAAVDGTHRMAPVNSSQDVKAALSLLGGMRVDQVAAVEVMWTPQAEGDTLTAEELMIDYPKLVPL